MFSPPELPQESGAVAGRKNARHRITLDPETWLNLSRGASARGISDHAVVLSATSHAIAMWSKSPRFSVRVECPAESADGTQATPDRSRTTVLAFDLGGDANFGERAAALQRDAVGSPDRLATHAGSADSTSENRGDAGSPVVFSSTLAHIVGGDAPHPSHAVSEPAAPGRAIVTIAARIGSGGLVVEFDHAHEWFSESVAAAMIGALGRFLEWLARDDAAWEQTPREVNHALLPPEQAKQRAAANATKAPVPEGVLFTGFLRQVAARGDAPAIIAPDRTLSYEDVHRRACALAHALHRHGVAASQLVAIVMPKSWAQIVATLGIQYAGGAYLPVDPELPTDRVKFLLEHGEARAIVTLASSCGALDFGSSRPVIELDRLEPAPPGTPLPVVDVRPGDLAYVIFTSGSTGVPKGVMIDHRGAWNTVVDVNTRFRVTASDRVLAVSRLSFDLSVYDIFGLLAAGGAIVMPNEDLARDPAHWADLVREHGVTLWNSVPALMQLLVDFAKGRAELLGASMRVVMMSGDWIPLLLPAQIAALWPRAERVSMGGATEASIWSILFPIGEVDPAWTSIPYGKPMVNQTFHVLHEDLSPCPDHVVGELYIGGIGVALGYWKDPEKTAARFITHPRTGERLYRTGDLGRYFPDGNIEFLGREDFQVKIHGFRIELGEIESHLATHAGVRRAVVVAEGDNVAGRRLVAYVVPATNPPVGAAELRAHLRARVPEYMVPAGCVFLDQLPLTANGKVNLKALPSQQPADHDSAASPEVVAPSTRTEKTLFEIWKTSLGLAQLGVHDNYFALGGGSLAGTRMIFKIRDAVRREVPVRFLFDHPTVAGMAAAIDGMSATAARGHEGQAAPPMRGHGPGTPLFFVPGVGGIEYLPRAVAEILQGARAYCDMLFFPGVDGKQPPLTTVEAIAADLVRQIRLARPRGPYAICGFCIGGNFAYEVARQLAAIGETVTTLVLWHGYTEHSSRRRSAFEVSTALLRRISDAGQGGRFALLASKVRLAARETNRRLINFARPFVGKKRRTLLDELDWLPPDTDKRVVDANFAACRAFHPKPYGGRVAMLVGDTDRLMIEYQPLFGWDHCLSGTVEIFKFPVEHLQLIEEPTVQSLARQTAACLAAADRGGPSPVVAGSRAARTVND